jgi:hypothetical protein
MKVLSCFVFFLLVVGCRPEYETRCFEAVSMDKRDTATLKLMKSAKDGLFYGDYRITYNGKEKEEGGIRGQIFGDTLIGKFNFLSRENVKKAAPIAWLMRGEQLHLGHGTAGTYLGLSVYKYGSITFPDSLLRFVPVPCD